MATLVQVQCDLAWQLAEDVEAQYNDFHSKLNQLVAG
jgi:hypothetical protein